MAPKKTSKHVSNDSPRDRHTSGRRDADRRTPATPAGPTPAGGDASGRPVQPLVIDGWTFVMAPHFALRWTNPLRMVIGLVATTGATATVAADRAGPEATMLRALIRVIRDHIARDPNDPAYRLTADLGAWRRVKFLGRFRLFFRFSSTKRVVILAWLNDENTLRKEGASTDPYAVFDGMLRRGEVPDTWEGLLASAKPLPPPLPEVER
jgi:toxin YhaV